MGSGTDIGQAARRLERAKRISVLTGAGVSAASGVPTFRGPQGLWKSWRPEDLATPEAFARKPELVWEWYDWRRQLVAGCQPNRAHEVLAAWSQRYPNFSLITQNVDGLHERAGTRGVIRYHGSLWEVRCARGCGPGTEDLRVPLPTLPPRCERCGGLLRPGVVWFGEPIPSEAAAAASCATDCDVFLSIGTSSLVYPAAGLLVEAARRGAYTIEINPDAAPLAATADLALVGTAEEVLDRLEVSLRSGLEPPGETEPEAGS